jgi:hypothetical protein
LRPAFGTAILGDPKAPHAAKVSAARPSWTSTSTAPGPETPADFAPFYDWSNEGEERSLTEAQQLDQQICQAACVLPTAAKQAILDYAETFEVPVNPGIELYQATHNLH